MSELGIEKVVVELNGFRQRTAMIKEEMSKVSRALNERAQQLNDLVNKSLSQLRDQLGGTTLSGFLALQGRDGEYDPQARRVEEADDDNGPARLEASGRSTDASRPTATSTISAII